jgi:hypothetical protein
MIVLYSSDYNCDLLRSFFFETGVKAETICMPVQKNLNSTGNFFFFFFLILRNHPRAASVRL